MVKNHLPVLSFEARQFSLAIGARGVEEDDNSSTARNGLTVDSDTGVVDDGEVGTRIADTERPVVVAVSSTCAERNHQNKGADKRDATAEEEE